MEEKKETSFFKSSKLSKTADQLWNESKSNFKAEQLKVQLDLGKTLTDDKKSSVKSAPSGPVQTKYVFGSNLAERAANAAKLSKVDNVISSEDDQSTSGLAEIADETSKGIMAPKSVSAVFEAIRQRECSASFCKKDTDSTQGGIKPLAEAKEFPAVSKSESSSIVSAASEINVFTGEEDEKTLLNCFVSSQAFTVGRSVSNQSVILNSRISSSIIIEKISTKRVKFSASTPDSSLPLMFLSTTSETVAEQFFKLLSGLKEEEDEGTIGNRKRRKSSASSNDECSKKAATL